MGNRAAENALALRLRDASVDDARSIARIHIASWRATYRGHMPDAVLDALDLEERSKRWKTRIASRSNVCIVAEVAPATLIGFCSLAPSRDPDAEATTAEIPAIYLDPNRWRRGAGRLLVEEATRRAASQGASQLTLWVLRENENARRFYEAVGFALDGVEKVDTSPAGSPLHEVRYRRALPRQEESPE